MLSHEREVMAATDGSDDAVAINAAIADLLATSRGGTVFLDASVYNVKTSITRGENIKIKGAFRGAGLFDKAATDGTILRWGGPAQGGAVVLDTPGDQAQDWLANGGISDLTIDGGGLIANGLASYSTIGASYERLHVFGTTKSGYYFGVVASSKVLPNYHSKLDDCNASVLGSAHGVVLDGPSDGGRNTCFLNARNCHMTFVNGYAFALTNCDDDTFVGCAASRAAGGTGPCIYFGGSGDGSGRAAFGNYFFGFHSNAPIKSVGGSFPARGNMVFATAVDGWGGSLKDASATLSPKRP